MNPKSVQCSISIVFCNVPSLSIYSNALDKRYTQLYAITIVVLLNIFIIYLLQQGSTGKPKCVVHSHRGLANDLLQLRATNLTVSIRSSMIVLLNIFIIYLLQQGSTGKPKCVLHSHRGLANDLLQLRATNLTVSKRSSMIEVTTIHVNNII